MSPAAEPSDAAIRPAVVVRAGPHRRPELEWVCDVLLRRRLGLEPRFEVGPPDRVEIDTGAGIVAWTDDFLSRADAEWLGAARAGSLVASEAACWPVHDAGLVERLGGTELLQLFGDGQWRQQPGLTWLPIDITGSSFFVLSRYEEACREAPVDRHGRFPAAAAALVRAGWSQRPCVDEWLVLLAWALAPLLPGWEPPATAPEVWVTADVDLPYSPGVASPMRAARQAAAHLLRERRPLTAAAAALNPLATRLGFTGLDPYETFDWMMDANEAAGQRITFFFICTVQATEYEGFYRIDEPRIAALMRRIVGRGHGVGLHASYASVEEPERLPAERRRLLDAMADAGAAPAGTASLGSRQHYLRWRADRTPALLDAAGFAFDASLGHAERPGFRCGTCHEYPLFDLAGRRALSIVERPLVAMDASVLSPSYLGLGPGEAARGLLQSLKATCRRFGGTFSLLWHNSMLVDGAERRLYRELLVPYGGAKA